MSDKYWHMLRAKRNKFLEATDKTQLSDFPLESKDRLLYREYRAYLRNLPTLYNEGSIVKHKVKTFEEWLEFKKSGVY